MDKSEAPDVHNMAGAMAFQTTQLNTNSTRARLNIGANYMMLLGNDDPFSIRTNGLRLECQDGSGPTSGGGNLYARVGLQGGDGGANGAVTFDSAIDRPVLYVNASVFKLMCGGADISSAFALPKVRLKENSSESLSIGGLGAVPQLRISTQIGDEAVTNDGDVAVRATVYVLVNVTVGRSLTIAGAVLAEMQQELMVVYNHYKNTPFVGDVLVGSSGLQKRGTVSVHRAIVGDRNDPYTIALDSYGKATFNGTMEVR
jgi:hypothetical protein